MFLSLRINSYDYLMFRDHKKVVKLVKFQHNMWHITTMIDCLAFPIRNPRFNSLDVFIDSLCQSIKLTWINRVQNVAVSKPRLSISSNQFTYFFFLSFNFRYKQIKANVQHTPESSEQHNEALTCVGAARGLCCKRLRSLSLKTLFWVKSSLLVQRHGRVKCFVREFWWIISEKAAQS